MQVSTAGKIYEAVKRAKDLGCNTMQIFSRNPQQWRANSLDSEDIRKFQLLQKKFKIKPIFIHIPYLINLASPNPRLYEASIEAYIEDILEVGALRADYIVTHMGSHKETSEEEGLNRLILALHTILKKTKDSRVGILLENTAGSGSWLGYRFWHQREVISALGDNPRLGLCFDTAHAYLAGYNIATKDGLEDTLDEIDRLVGINRIKLIHLNDALGKLDSRHDRHEHIGKGSIGLEGMKRIINHPRLRKLPFILETPKKSEDDDKRNLATVRRLRVAS
ncbi:MAG: deoxyribonuclease IV [Candidatus Omnitrophica bacterium]|nr:deoxyribonuclease IV [Candidatus Omnitrophota bacterium]